MLRPFLGPRSSISERWLFGVNACMYHRSRNSRDFCVAVGGSGMTCRYQCSGIPCGWFAS
eukprot:13176673-Alexandrium_andersonii.AAC.1